MRTLTSPQLSELEAFWIAEGGWGEWKQDYRFGQLCSIHANINRDKKKKSNPYTADDFAMRPKQKRQVDAEEAERKIRHTLDGLAGIKKKKPGKAK